MENQHTEDERLGLLSPSATDNRTRPSSTDNRTRPRQEGNISRGRGSVNDEGDSPLARVLARLPGWTQNGKGYTARCPAHDDKTPSLNITTADDSKVLLKCFADCPTEAIVEKMGLTMADLFPRKSTTRTPRMVEAYEYTDENGNLLFQSVRFDPKDFKQRRPDGNGGWTWDLKKTRRVLYRLPELLQAETVYMPEGEKDVDTLRGWGLVATCNPSGAGNWRDEYSTSLAGKHVVILPDNDAAGEKHALQVARSVLPVAASVKLVRLPDLPTKGDVTDWRNAGHTKEKLLALVEAASPWTEEAHAPVVLPELKVTANLTEMVDAAENALIQNFPKPVLYQRARIICRIAPAGEPPKWLQRPPDTPIIIRADTISLREYSGQSGQWVKYDKRAKEWFPVLPPAVVFEALAARSTWKFPHLEGIIGAPTLRPDGVLVHKPGYDKETGLYLDLNGVHFPPVPDTPTREDAKAALDILYDPFADFPFQDDCHRAAALAGVLTVVGRFAIPGNVPAFVARAHAKGSGKGLLVNTIATIGTGRTAPTWTQTLDEAEEGKRLLSIALAGDAVMHIDNITKPFGSAKLDSALTSGTVKDRLLGSNINQEAPWLTVVFASGNNLTFVGDMVRRVVPINLDPKVEHPEERTDFRHAPLLDWVRTERPRLVTAALTALKAFFHAGCPKQPNVSEFGSFEQWSNLIRHSLIWAGFPDPCGGRKHLEEESDTSYEALATLLHCWAECYPDTQARLTLKIITQDVERRQIPDPDAITPANKWNALHDALSAYDTKYDGKRLDTRRIGNSLRTIEGTVLGNQRLIRAGESQKVALWKRELLK